MKQTRAIIASIGFLVACAGSGAILAPATAPALQGITGIDALMGAPCNANWSRIAPHICGRTVVGSITTLVNDNTCRSIDLNAAYGVSTASQFAVLQHENSLTTAPNFYSDASCTNVFTSGNITSTRIHIPVRLVNGVLWYKSASSGAPAINAIMYYD